MASLAIKTTLERIAVYQFTPAHSAQARAMLGWSVEELSRQSGVSTQAIRRFEAGASYLMSPAWPWPFGWKPKAWCSSRALRLGAA